MQSIKNYRGFYKIIRRFSKISQYVLSGGKVVEKIKKHIELATLLQPFRQDDLIGRNTFVIYLFSYLSRSFSIADKLRAIHFHYSLLKERYSLKQLRPIFLGGLTCYAEEKDGEIYSVVLGMNRSLEIEGSLSLYLKVNGVKTSVLSFSFIDGEIINAEHNAIAFISCLQQVGRRADLTEKAMAHFNDIMPALILLNALEALCASLDIKYCAGVSAYNQLSFNNIDNYEKFYAVYDKFWKLNGGTQIGGNYLMALPLYQKDILSIKQTHRNRARKKRQKHNDIYDGCLERFTAILG